MNYKKRKPSEETIIDASKRPTLTLDSTIQYTQEINLDLVDTYELQNSSPDSEIKNQDQSIDLSNTVMPDPNSEVNVYKKGWALESLRVAKSEFSNKKNKILMVNQPKPNLKLSNKQLQIINNTFKEKILSISEKCVILKDRKFGYEIFINGVDNRYWVNALEFHEPINFKNPKYNHVWQGNSFIGYGFKTFEECLEKTNELMVRGKTGVNLFKDYVVDINFERNRFISSTRDFKLFNYVEYCKIEKWYLKNKINIMIKTAGQKDLEDLNDEIKSQFSQKLKTTAVQAIQSKMLLPPRRCKFMISIPCQNPKYRGKDFANPENKLYKIGFLFND
ncbi:hypothetical protein [Spiroplasma endosymbiont of Panorpa germanica]|uniref:hypothetical protein n=1 Tax=Spiroplasma endosymbiont of Panorpa germanica TaxID=3066314 RepID=UPI0030CD43ED